MKCSCMYFGNLLRLVYFMCVKLQSQVVIGICETLLPTIILANNVQSPANPNFMFIVFSILFVATPT